MSLAPRLLWGALLWAAAAGAASAMCPPYQKVETPFLDEHVIYFDSGSSRFDGCVWYERVLEDYVGMLRASGFDTHVEVVAHADRAGDAAYNLRLSAQRGRRVKAALERLGIPGSRIVVRAMGETNPPTRTEDGVPQQLNRVVAIVLPVPNGGSPAAPKGASSLDAVASRCPPFTPPTVPLDEHLVHFEPNSDRTPNCAVTDYVLRDVVRLFRLHGGVVELRAHTDRLGGSRYNEQLARRRGEAVKRALVWRGLPATAVRVHAFGETALPVPTPDEVSEPLNRLVSIRVTPADGAVIPSN